MLRSASIQNLSICTRKRISIENIPNTNDGELGYDIIVKTYNKIRQRREINVLALLEMYLQRIITYPTDLQEQAAKYNPCIINSVTYLTMSVQHLTSSDV